MAHGTKQEPKNDMSSCWILKEFIWWIHHPTFDNCVLVLAQHTKKKWKPRTNEIPRLTAMNTK